MKEIETKAIRYVCDNCGAEHEYPHDIKKCRFSGKEFCNNCKCIVRVYNPHTKRWLDIYIHPSAYVHTYNENLKSYCEQCNDIYEEYEKAKNKLQEEYEVKWKTLNMKYLKGELND
jgi:hypothetical protein